MSEGKSVLTEQGIPCGCGRSATGYCNGSHRYSAEEWDRMLLEDSDVPVESVVASSVTAE